MTIVLWLLVTQCLLGGFDNLWHHEITERLPAKRSARYELALHAAREFLYAIIFLGLAWREWHGAWAWVLCGLLLLEVVITLADFIEEDRTRILPRMERVLHTVLAVNLGVWFGAFFPHIYRWSMHESALIAVDYGWFSRAFTVAAVGVCGWALRNLYAVLKHARPPDWVRNPIYVGSNSAGRVFLVTGATGFIGTAMVRKLLSRGDSVIVLSRDADKALDKFGPHVRVVTSLDAINDNTRIDGIVNLAGAPILGMPWFAARRRELLASRLRTTHAVVRLSERLSRPPRVLVSGSAIGFYGARGGENADDKCDESAAPQSQFQSELCQQWEAAADAAQSIGVRTVLLRTGLVLGTSGGALPMMALPITLFFGSRMGDGLQWMSWIHLDDVVGLIELALDRPTLSGPLNATAPKPVRHREFQRLLAKQLRRPVWLRVPAWLVHALLGEMSQLLIAGQRVLPHKSGVHGFRFKYPTLPLALAALFPARTLRASGAVTEVYFNGQCPVCSAEMTRYAAIAQQTSLPLRFIDSTATPQALACYGLRTDHLQARIYVRDARGRVASGFAAVLLVWQQLPRYRSVARIAALPGVWHIAVAVYDLVIAPTLTWWARERQRKHSWLSNR
jgi:uncharacterized protein (TIGR01777 family)